MSQETRGADAPRRHRAPTSRAIRRELELIVDREAAAFSAWYELLPRSQSDDPTRHGTFDDVIAQAALCARPRLRRALFPADPPDRPRPTARARTTRSPPRPDDPGSPYAIGSHEGGHDAHPSRARHASRISRGWSTAARDARPRDRARLRHPVLARPSLDQASIPEWFDWRPDGTIKFAENPPKKYEDIVNVHFYREAHPRRSGIALRDVVLFWVEQGREDLPRRQPAHQAAAVLGVDDPRGAGPPSRRDLPRRGVHPAEDDEAPRQARLHPVLHLLHLAQHEAGADRLPDRADADRVPPTTCGRTSSSTRPTSTRYYLQTERAAGLPGRGSSWPRRSPATTASTTASSSARRRRCPARRNISTREKYEIKAWDWDRPGNIQRRHRAGQPAAPRAPGAAGLHATSPSTTPGTTTSSITAR